MGACGCGVHREVIMPKKMDRESVVFCLSSGFWWAVVGLGAGFAVVGFGVGQMPFWFWWIGHCWIGHCLIGHRWLSIVGWPSLAEHCGSWVCLDWLLGFAWIGRWVGLDWPSLTYRLVGWPSLGWPFVWIGRWVAWIGRPRV